MPALPASYRAVLGSLLFFFRVALFVKIQNPASGEGTTEFFVHARRFFKVCGNFFFKKKIATNLWEKICDKKNPTTAFVTIFSAS
jgi:hypothetical protein